MEASMTIRTSEFYKLFLLGFLILSITSLLIACGGGEEEDTESSNPNGSSISDEERAALFGSSEDTESSNTTAANTPQTNNTSTQTSPTNSPAPTATPNPIVTSNDQAARILWAKLTECISVDVQDVKVDIALDNEWIAMPSASSPQEFGAWKIDSYGNINPHNKTGRDWNKFIDSACESDDVKLAATDVLNKTDAISVLWSQLSKCNPELNISYLESEKDQINGSWVVRTTVNYNDDYGLWNVDRDASVTPLNARANEVWKSLSILLVPDDNKTDELGRPIPQQLPENTNTSTNNSQNNDSVNSTDISKCSPVIRTNTEAQNRVYGHLSSCYPNASISSVIWDAGLHYWIIVTNENESSSTWNVDRDGTVTPANSSAETTNDLADSGNC